MPDISEETKALVYICEAIHDGLADKRFTKDDRDLIELSCVKLLTKLRPGFRAGNA